MREVVFFLIKTHFIKTKIKIGLYFSAHAQRFALAILVPVFLDSSVHLLSKGSERL